MIGQIIFIIILAAAIYLFSKNVSKVRRNILLGKDTGRSDNPGLRWKTMAKIALGQTKMVKRPFAAVMHFFIYVGFVIINIEVLEIMIDGIFGSHRVFSHPLGGLYGLLIGGFEVLAVLVLVACVAFLVRRKAKVQRFADDQVEDGVAEELHPLVALEAAIGD